VAPRPRNDISKIVLPIPGALRLRTEGRQMFVQCFELAEVQRLRGELGWAAN